MLDEKFVKALVDLGAKTAPAIVTTEKEPRHVYFVPDGKGGLLRCEAEEPPVVNEVRDLDTLARVLIWAESPATKETIYPEIWYCRTGIVGLLDTGSNWAAKATLSLSPSPQFAKLIEWESRSSTKLTQKELVILLRTLFKDSAPPDLLPLIRKVSTKKAANTASEVAKGKVSLGKEMIAEMSGVNELEDFYLFRFPVFSTASLSFRSPVRVVIDPDPEQELFTVCVIPGDCEAAWTGAEAWLGSSISSALVDNWTGDKGTCPIPVYFGKSD